MLRIVVRPCPLVPQSLANPYGSLGRRETPEEYDWRARVKGGAWNLKPLDRSGKINPKDPKTW